MENTNVGSLTKSSSNPVGKSPQLLAQVAALPSTQTDKQSYEQKKLLVALALLKSLLDNTPSPDVRELSMWAACGHLRGILPEREVMEIALAITKRLRQPNPMDSMF